MGGATTLGARKKKDGLQKQRYPLFQSHSNPLGCSHGGAAADAQWTGRILTRKCSAEPLQKKEPVNHPIAVSLFVLRSTKGTGVFYLSNRKRRATNPSESGRARRRSRGSGRSESASFSMSSQVTPEGSHSSRLHTSGSRSILLEVDRLVETMVNQAEIRFHILPMHANVCACS